MYDKNMMKESKGIKLIELLIMIPRDDIRSLLMKNAFEKFLICRSRSHSITKHSLKFYI